MKLSIPQFRQALKTLSQRPGVMGWVLVARDGICIHNECPGLPSPDTFSAMGAALVGAAEMAQAELGDPQTPRVVVEGPRTRLVAVAVGDESLLIVVLSKDAKIEPLLPEIEAAAQEVGRLAES